MKTFAIIGAMISGLTFSCAANAQQISELDLRIGGVAIGQSENEVVKLHGLPRTKTNNGEGTLFEYNDFEVIVGVGPNGVLDIISRSPKACTPSKLCPGDPISKANKLYGSPVVASRESGTYFEYTPEGSTCWLQVSAPENIILSMRIACQP